MEGQPDWLPDCPVQIYCNMRYAQIRKRKYLAVNLESFYASVECVERGLNPMTTHLMVAEKTICLAVTPPLKACGISEQAKLFEVVEKVRIISAYRLSQVPG